MLVGAVWELQQKQSSGSGWSGLVLEGKLEIWLVSLSDPGACITESVEPSVASRSSDWQTPGTVMSIIAQQMMSPAISLRQPRNIPAF
jgi:hypothetical protein